MKIAPSKDRRLGGSQSQTGHERSKNCSFICENLKGRDHLKDLSIDGRIILKKILKKLGVRMWTASEYGPQEDCCEHGNEPLGYLKGRELSVQLSGY
jgi:hypothetical protein